MVASFHVKVDLDLYRDEGGMPAVLPVLSYSVTEADSPDWGPTDGLQVGWSYPTGTQVYPSQPDPVLLRFGLVLEDVADLAGLGIGDHVEAAVYVGATRSTVAAQGWYRITDMQSEPVTLKRGGATVQGVLVGVTAVDYTADLAEDEDALPATFSSDIGATVEAILEAAVPTVTVPTMYLPASSQAPATTDVSTLAALRYFLAWTPWVIWLGSMGATLANPFRGVLVMEDPETAEVKLAAGRRNFGEVFPGVLNSDGTVTWDAAGPGDTAALWVADACTDTDVAVRHTRTKRTATNRWVVKSGSNSSERAVRDLGYTPKVTYRLETDLNDQEGVEFCADSITPTYADVSGWVADGYTVHLHDDSELAAATYPLIVDPANVTRTLTHPLVVANIPASQNPVTNGADYAAGVLGGATLTVARGRASVRFTLVPQLPSAYAGDSAAPYITADRLAAEYPTMTVDDLDEGVSSMTMSLVRDPATNP